MSVPAGAQVRPGSGHQHETTRWQMRKTVDQKKRRGGMRRAFAATAAGLMAAAGALAAAPTASAAPGGVGYVAFGDSYAANPTIGEQLAGFTQPDRCGQGADAYPVRLGNKLGMSTANAACNGVSINGMAGPGLGFTADRAAARGQLGDNTRLVTITVGGAEGWNLALADRRDFGVTNGGDFLNYQEFVNRMRGPLNTIRHHAPNARILFVGYPAVGNDRGEVCLINADVPPELGTPNIAAPVPTNATGFLNKLDNIARDAAGELGYEYVETRRAGTDTCAPTPNRWVHGVLDSQMQQMTFHPSDNGNEAIAQITADHVR